MSWIKNKFLKNPLKYFLLCFLIVGIIALLFGYFLSKEIHPKPNFHPIFKKIFITNLSVHLTTIVCSFLSCGLFSYYFVLCQFFLVGVLIGGATNATGNLFSSISFFWIHGIFELSTVILTASIVPFFLISVFSLLVKKFEIKKGLIKITKQTLFLLAVMFFLIFISAILETFIAPKLIFF